MNNIIDLSTRRVCEIIELARTFDDGETWGRRIHLAAAMLGIEDGATIERAYYDSVGE